MTLDAAAWNGWLGRSETADDVITASRIDGLVAALDYPDPKICDGDTIPPGWHRLFFHETIPTSELRLDGHPSAQEFMPPVPLPRRMWANTRLKFDLPLHIGERIRRVSTIAAIDEKQGRTGSLVFVTTRMDFFGECGLAVTEEQTSVFRDTSTPGAGLRGMQTPSTNPAWERTIDPSPVLLFRYSALTMNCHRIHYDRPYAVDVEGYPGLLVHGSLQTLLLLDLVRHQCPGKALESGVVRAQSPIFNDAPFQVQGSPGSDGQTADAWTLTADGKMAISGHFVFAP